MGISDHLTCLLRNLYAGQKQQLELGNLSKITSPGTSPDLNHSLCGWSIDYLFLKFSGDSVKKHCQNSLTYLGNFSILASSYNSWLAFTSNL